ncbi:TetR family transcriptional regulator [Actinocatenispora thailandica]|uniref:TetR family transcriptional regulator n=1 Tax=Actinocatenispora thailandica TaxID=227318 RepID=A0A7R7DJB4_9ACTN|nr:TetR/AcrR family transcriptional regulator [Actinocatenispora thailandica]BCJ32728.1 TetR family transcriptional regulator [Actinocatenispora thailandica]
MKARQDSGPRERLLTAAQRLTYEHGPTVGVDALLTEANVARRSLYEHFGGKDGLIAEMLRRSADEDIQRYRAVLDGAGDDPRARLLAVFDELDAIVTRPGFRGCRYLGADLALPAEAHPAHAVTGDYRERIHALLEHELVRLRHPDPGAAADQLQLLIEGTLATGAARPGTHPGRIARQLAERILD